MPVTNTHHQVLELARVAVHVYTDRVGNDSSFEQKKRDLKERIYNAYVETLRSAKRISLCTLQLELSKKTTEIAQGKLFEGDGNLLDTIQAQSEKTRIAVELSKAKVNYNITSWNYFTQAGY